MIKLGAMERCKASFHRLLVVLLGATLLSQLALLPSRANCLSINAIAEAAPASDIHWSLSEEDSVIRNANRVKRHFTDAGSHKHFSRALDQRFITEGARFICRLNRRDYPEPSSWLDVSAILDYNEGWQSQILKASDDVLGTLQPWLEANDLSASVGDYQTVQTRNDRNKVGSTSGKDPTLAPMKNIYNVAQGTIIVEEVLNPKAAPDLKWNSFERNLQSMQLTLDEYIGFGLDVPPRDASGYEIPTLTQWSDIAYLQLVRASGNTQVQGVKRIIQYHITNPSTQAQIVEALETVSETKTSVNINTGGSAVEFPADSDACKALFKTPNGNGGYFLFAQHPQQMGSKTLEKITVFTSTRNANDNESINGEDTSVWYYMVAHFIDAPEQDL